MAADLKLVKEQVRELFLALPVARSVSGPEDVPLERREIIGEEVHLCYANTKGWVSLCKFRFPAALPDDQVCWYRRSNNENVLCQECLEILGGMEEEGPEVPMNLIERFLWTIDALYERAQQCRVGGLAFRTMVEKTIEKDPRFDKDLNVADRTFIYGYLRRCMLDLNQIRYPKTLGEILH